MAAAMLQTIAEGDVFGMGTRDSFKQWGGIARLQAPTLETRLYVMKLVLERLPPAEQGWWKRC